MMISTSSKKSNSSSIRDVRTNQAMSSCFIVNGNWSHNLDPLPAPRSFATLFKFYGSRRRCADSASPFQFSGFFFFTLFGALTSSRSNLPATPISQDLQEKSRRGGREAWVKWSGRVSGRKAIQSPNTSNTSPSPCTFVPCYCPCMHNQGEEKRGGREGMAMLI